MLYLYSVKCFQHSWWGRVGGMVRKRSKQVRKEKPLEFPPRMKTFLLLPAAGIEPMTSWFGVSLRILVHHLRLLGHRISPKMDGWVDGEWIINGYTRWMGGWGMDCEWVYARWMGGWGMKGWMNGIHGIFTKVVRP